MRVEGQLKVWWIESHDISNYFKMEVKDLSEAMLVIKTLTRYARYQFDNRLRNQRPKYGATGLMVFENDSWVEWEDITGKVIDELIKEQPNGK